MRSLLLLLGSSILLIAETYKTPPFGGVFFMSSFRDEDLYIHYFNRINYLVSINPASFSDERAYLPQ